MSIDVIEASQLGILLVDAQPLFWDYAFPEGNTGKEAIMVRMEHLLMLADWLELPVLATFEDPVKDNGELPERLEKVCPERGQKFTKKTNCWICKNSGAFQYRYSCCLHQMQKDERFSCFN